MSELYFCNYSCRMQRAPRCGLRYYSVASPIGDAGVLQAAALRGAGLCDAINLSFQIVKAMDGKRSSAVTLSALLGLVVAVAHAEIAIDTDPAKTQMTLLDVQTVPELFAAARAISGPSLGTATFASSRIVGVFPKRHREPGPRLLRAEPVREPKPPPNSGRFVALVPAMSASGLSWLEPYDVNAAGLVVGQAQGSVSTLRYAFTRPAQSGTVTPVPGLDGYESKATAVNNPVGTTPTGTL